MSRVGSRQVSSTSPHRSARVSAARAASRCDAAITNTISSANSGFSASRRLRGVGASLISATSMSPASRAATGSAVHSSASSSPRPAGWRSGPAARGHPVVARCSTRRPAGAAVTGAAGPRSRASSSCELGEHARRARRAACRRRPWASSPRGVRSNSRTPRLVLDGQQRAADGRLREVQARRPPRRWCRAWPARGPGAGRGCRAGCAVRQVDAVHASSVCLNALDE